MIKATIGISIIVPVFNVEEYLEKCLLSLLEQDFCDYEIICVNDGSTDNSTEILNSYAKKFPIIKIINQENKGLSGARNTGLRYAKGDYILFVDSDDYLENNVLKSLLSIATENDIDILDFNCNSITSDNKRRLFNKDVFINERTVTGIEYLSFFSQKYKRLPQISAWSHLFKTEFLMKNKLVFIEGIYYEDLPFVLKAYSLAKNVYYANIDVYNYVYNMNSITRVKWTSKHLADLVKVSEEVSKISIAYNVFLPMDVLLNAYRNQIGSLILNCDMNQLKSQLKSNPFKKIRFNLAKIRLKYIFKISRFNFIFFIFYSFISTLSKKIKQTIR